MSLIDLDTLWSAAPTFASIILDNMDSEFVLDWVLSSCQVSQGNGGCKFNICDKEKEALGKSQWESDHWRL